MTILLNGDVTRMTSTRRRMRLGQNVVETESIQPHYWLVVLGDFFGSGASGWWNLFDKLEMVQLTKQSVVVQTWNSREWPKPDRWSTNPRDNQPTSLGADMFFKQNEYPANSPLRLMHYWMIGGGHSCINRWFTGCNCPGLSLLVVYSQLKTLVSLLKTLGVPDGWGYPLLDGYTCLSTNFSHFLPLPAIFFQSSSTILTILKLCCLSGDPYKP